MTVIGRTELFEKNRYIRIMTRENMKSELHKIIDNVPDEMLEEIYKVLKEFAGKNPDSIKLSHHLNKILIDDKGLLERLAK